jgi:hypothetical protein
VSGSGVGFESGLWPKIKLEFAMANAEIRLNVILDLFNQIHNNAARKRRLEYVVVPSEDIRGKSLEEMKKLTFNVGVTKSNSVGLSAKEVTALFTFMKGQFDQLRSLQERRRAGIAMPAKPQIESRVNLDPTDEEIRRVLSGVQFTIELPNETQQAPHPMTDTYGLTQDRIEYVLSSLLKKKIDAATSGIRVNHFQVYPPVQYLADPSPLQEPYIYDRFKDSVWWLRWYDGQYDQLRFIELLIFADQIIRVTQFMQESHADIARQAAAHPTDTIGIKLQTGFNPAQLSLDETIRALLSHVEIEKEERPKQAAN